MSRKEKTRLDLLLVQRGLVESREKAKRMIMAGLVKVNNRVSDKPGHLIPVSSKISLEKPSLPYVSRGGLKLEAALDRFSVEVKGKILMDVGASTGGFTDCLLQRGAEKVVAVDVGYGQLHWKIRQDSRVVIFEKTNIRYLGPDQIREPINGAVIDVSFISLKLVIPPVSRLLLDEAFIVALIKPQFEVEKDQVGKGGVVRDLSLREEVVANLVRFFEEADWQVKGCIPSPILGPKGNQEYLLYLIR
jgi:23S rRNA (cytidine1920-2'-O)/16S rRNA (cytidine1409-2'-O)-methyltransferase